jgi:hypothetical protein
MERLKRTTGKYEHTALLRRALDDRTASFRDGQWEAIDAVVNWKSTSVANRLAA